MHSRIIAITSITVYNRYEKSSSSVGTKISLQRALNSKSLLLQCESLSATELFIPIRMRESRVENISDITVTVPY